MAEKKEFNDCKVYIIGPLSLQNEILLYVIKKEIVPECTIFDRELNSFSASQDVKSGFDGSKILIIIDSAEQSFEEILKSITTNTSLSGCRIALFNLNENSGVEKKALARNIRGFFYKDDHFEIFLKGIRTILLGEIWI